jgi:antitoxin component of RelBE/YafQ-DinJ toxin-antitoxin module
MKKTNLLQIRIDEELLNSLSKLAKTNGLSISSQVRMLIKKGVDNG